MSYVDDEATEVAASEEATEVSSSEADDADEADEADPGSSDGWQKYGTGVAASADELEEAEVVFAELATGTPFQLSQFLRAFFVLHLRFSDVNTCAVCSETVCFLCFGHYPCSFPARFIKRRAIHYILVLTSGWSCRA
jgi:hypothetical protein